MRPKSCAPVAHYYVSGVSLFATFSIHPSTLRIILLVPPSTVIIHDLCLLTGLCYSMERLARVWSANCFSVQPLSSIYHDADVTDLVPLHSCTRVILVSRSASEQHYSTRRVFRIWRLRNQSLLRRFILNQVSSRNH